MKQPDAYDRARARSLIRAADKDPSLWPVAPGVRIYLVDCPVCTNRMPPWNLERHIQRRHG